MLSRRKEDLEEDAESKAGEAEEYKGGNENACDFGGGHPGEWFRLAGLLVSLRRLRGGNCLGFSARCFYLWHEIG